LICSFIILCYVLGGSRLPFLILDDYQLPGRLAGTQFISLKSGDQVLQVSAPYKFST
jgi:hypothetical protein